MELNSIVSTSCIRIKDDNSDSSYSLNDFYDIEHLVFITNNKKIIELDADLNDSFYFFPFI